MGIKDYFNFISSETPERHAEDATVYDEERIKHENEIVNRTAREQSGFSGYQNINEYEDFVDSTPVTPQPEPKADDKVQHETEPQACCAPLEELETEPETGTIIITKNSCETAPQPAPAPMPDYSPRFDELAMQLDSMFEKVEMFQATIEKQNQIIVTQNRQLEKHNEDIVLKLQKPVLLQIIEYVDRIQEILDNDDRIIDKDHTTRLNELRNDIENLQRTIVSDLENYQIYQFKDTDENPLVYSQGRQQVKDREESSNENEFMRYGEGVKMFYRTTFPGYLMTAENKNGEPVDSILRREEVVKVVYRPVE